MHNFSLSYNLYEAYLKDNESFSSANLIIYSSSNNLLERSSFESTFLCIFKIYFINYSFS